MIMTLALAWAAIGTNNAGIMGIAIITAPLDFIAWLWFVAVAGDTIQSANKKVKRNE